MDDQEKDYKFTLDQYRVYSDLLRQTSFQRSISNYFFIMINVVIILIGYFSMPMKTENLAIFSLLSLIGVILCIYWIQEQRELYVLNEVRFRTLMELESKLIKYGALNWEWEHLGDYKFRRSPVLFVSLSRTLPFVFILIHIIILLMFIIILRFIK